MGEEKGACGGVVELAAMLLLLHGLDRRCRLQLQLWMLRLL